MTLQVRKLREKLVRDKLVIFIEILAIEQHGFRRGRSYLACLLVTLEKWAKLYDDGLLFKVLYFHFWKAFDSVSHARLVYQ